MEGKEEALERLALEVVFKDFQEKYEALEEVLDSRYFSHCFKGEIGEYRYSFVSVNENFIQKSTKYLKSLGTYLRILGPDLSLEFLNGSTKTLKFVYLLIQEISLLYQKPFTESFLFLSTYFSELVVSQPQSPKPPLFCPICKKYLCIRHPRKEPKAILYTCKPVDLDLTWFKGNWKGLYFEKFYRGAGSRRWCSDSPGSLSLVSLPKSFVPLLFKLPVNNSSGNCSCNPCSDTCPCTRGTAHSTKGKAFDCRGYCELYCKCPFNCPFKFLGCDCPGPCRETCICFINSIECNPWLCRRCGCQGDLKYGTSSCLNVRVQKGDHKKKRVRLAKSLIENAGLGVFIDEPIQQGDFIGEYTGEILSEKEANRRGALYDLNEHSFLFMLDSSLTIDATFYGSPMRYINHKRAQEANSYTQNWRVQGSTKIMVLAKRDIKKGEEVFFDYLYTKEVQYKWYKDYNIT